MKIILLTGGCGFIGSHCAVELIKNQYHVIIVDNLVNSSITILDSIEKLTQIRPTFYQRDITNEDQLNQVFDNHSIDAVIHLAGYKSVSQSIDDPLTYYHNNVTGLITLLKCMNKHNVLKIIFSSSATVYGNPEKLPITEDCQINILNPYGQTKLMSELILKDSPCTSIILRYFNPVGSYPLLSENPKGIPTNLFPVILSVYNNQKQHLDIYGSDYETHDGTPVRDYIHVVDLARAHVKALEYRQSDIFNLGTGAGYSVLDIVNAFETCTKQKLPCVLQSKRPGDAAVIYADSTKAKTLLNWEPTMTLTDMVDDTIKNNFKTTFVTAFCSIDDYKVPGKSLDHYFNQFTLLAKTGIPLAVYISSHLKDLFSNLIKPYPHVKLMDVLDIHDTWIYKTAHVDGIKLPMKRNELKDTFDYMVMQNLKLELCQRVIQKNPFHTEYFAWIDFGIFHVVKDFQKTTSQLQSISKTNFIKTNVIFPGCWPKGLYIDYILNQICWRYCGGFFLGHQDALCEMWQKYQLYLQEFIKNYKMMTWEVNLWAALEYQTDWSPIHYMADHNDSMLVIPDQYKL